MENIYLSLGSNIGDRKDYIDKAILLLSTLSGIKNIFSSSYYETEPVGYLEQSKFINVVLGCECDYTPAQLLTYTQQIEKKLGREKNFRWGPRVIDIDILIFGEQVIHTDTLCIPHARMFERAFVLIPLAEIDEKYNQYLNELSRNERDGVKKLVQ